MNPTTGDIGNEISAKSLILGKSNFCLNLKSRLLIHKIIDIILNKIKTKPTNL